MSSPHLFQVSFYLSQALAMVCLAYAESFFLWWIWIYLAGVLGLLAAAFRLEGRWHLSIAGVNRWGVVIALLLITWIYFKIPRSEEEYLSMGVPWPAGLLPILAPLPPVLMLVKLYRPKAMADFWGFQVLTLMTMTLACVLAGDPFFFVLFLLYVGSALWSLLLYYPRWQSLQARLGLVRAEKEPLFAIQPELNADPGRWWGLGRVARWTLSIAFFAMVLFLAAPRLGNQQWVPQKLGTGQGTVLRSGIDPGIDLHHTGNLVLSQEPAFEVQCFNLHGPFGGLSEDTRYTMEVLDWYDHGRWKSWYRYPLTEGPVEPRVLVNPPVQGTPDPEKIPDFLQENQLYLVFEVKFSQAGGLPLANPASAHLPLGWAALRNEEPYDQSLFETLPGSDIIKHAIVSRRGIYSYGQVYQPGVGTDFRPAELQPPYMHFLLEQTVPAPIRPWVDNVLLDLPGLTDADVRLDEQNRIRPLSQEKVARALSRYFSSSGDFTYSLKLQRRNLKMDPTVDFLFNLREGHCERYAGALTLCLRSLGIPARVVKGYAGGEPLEEARYLVRQSQAHSWVEVLLPASEPGRFQWLTLDPTPSRELTSRSLADHFWRFLGSLRNTDYWWKTYVMDLNQETQSDTWNNLRHGWTQTRRQQSFWIGLRNIGIGLAGLAVVFFGQRWIKRRWANRARSSKGQKFPDWPAFSRFKSILARNLALQPTPGQTPLEIAQDARILLQDRDIDADLQTLPDRLVSLLYHTRFGGLQPPPADLQRLENDLNRLDLALQANP